MSEADREEMRRFLRDWIGGRHAANADVEVARAEGSAMWREAGELGWSGIMLAERLGGAGLSYDAYALLAEEAGRELALAPFLSSSLLSVEALAECADPVAETVLRAIGAGKLVVGFAHDESAHHGAGLSTQAKGTEPGACRLVGSKRFVVDGAAAGAFLVSAIASEGPGLYLTMAEGHQVEVLDTVDGRALAHVDFDGPATRVGGAADLQRLLDLGRLGLATEMLGAARRALEITVDYLRTREQFGVAIGSFQALQHRAAERLVANELAAACVEEGWRAAVEERSDFAELACLAKRISGDALHAVTREMIQMHGGIGMTAEHSAGRFLKWGEASSRILGDTHYLEDQFARRMGY